MKYIPKLKLHAFLLIIWIAIGSFLRVLNLDALPPWTDECATAVFSLGNSFLPVPLNEWVTTETVLEPLKYQSENGLGEVVDRLFQESTHPPLFFMLLHLWLTAFSIPDHYISLWILRLPSALFGIFSIPAIFALSWLTFRSYSIAHLSAALMAVSPFAIFLARQARHYTLVILIIITSLCFLVRAIEAVQQGRSLPRWFGWLWAGVNGIGIATHYFFSLTLVTESIVLVALIYASIFQNPRIHFGWTFRQIYIAILGTLATGLAWFPILFQIYNTPLTNWVKDGDPRSEWIEPLLRMVLWIVSMLFALPSAFSILPIWVIIVSGVIMLGILILFLPGLLYGLKQQYSVQTSRLGIQVFGGYVSTAIGLFLLLTYVLEIDLTLADRFQFVYFPALMIILGAALGAIWNYSNVLIEPETSLQSAETSNFWVSWQTLHLSLLKSVFPGLSSGQEFVIKFLTLGLVGGILVVWNLTYLQNHRPDLIVSQIQATSQAPIVIATGHQHHGDTGRMMGIAWKFRNLPANEQPQFFLASWRGYNDSIATLRQTVRELPRPLEVWFIDILGDKELEVEGCERGDRGDTGEHRHQTYHCV